MPAWVPTAGLDEFQPSLAAGARGEPCLKGDRSLDTDDGETDLAMFAV